jgi:hypothetical protein
MLKMLRVISRLMQMKLKETNQYKNKLNFKNNLVNQFIVILEKIQ